MYLGHLVTVPLKALEHTTRRIHPQYRLECHRIANRGRGERQINIPSPSQEMSLQQGSQSCWMVPQASRREKPGMLGVPSATSVCLFSSVCFSIPIPPPSQPGSSSALNRSLKGLEADFLYERLLKPSSGPASGRQESRSRGQSPPPPSLLLPSSCQVLTALDAQSLPLTPAQVPALGAAAKPRAPLGMCF